MMIDNPDQVERLMDDLEAMLPIAASFESTGWKHLIKDGVVPPGTPNSVTIKSLVYGGDYGGISCCLAEHTMVCSLTHLRFKPKFPLYRDITAYQKRRVKKLKKQNSQM